MAINRDEAKAIMNWVRNELRKQGFQTMTDGKLNLGSPTIGKLPAIKVSISDDGGYYASTTVEEALQELGSETTSGITFISLEDLDDDNYTGSAYKIIVVKSDETGIELRDMTYLDGGAISGATGTAWLIDDHCNIDGGQIGLDPNIDGGTIVV